jgi:hypothetical protein
MKKDHIGYEPKEQHLKIKIGKGLRIEGSKASIKKLAILCQCSNPHTNSKIKKY